MSPRTPSPERKIESLDEIAILAQPVKGVANESDEDPFQPRSPDRPQEVHESESYELDAFSSFFLLFLPVVSPVPIVLLMARERRANGTRCCRFRATRVGVQTVRHAGERWEMARDIDRKYNRQGQGVASMSKRCACFQSRAKHASCCW